MVSFFLIDLMHVMFCDAVNQFEQNYVKISVTSFNECSNINDKQLNINFLMLMRNKVRKYLEHYFSIIFDNKDKKEILEKIISKLKSPEENFDICVTSLDEELTLFIVLFLEYVIGPSPEENMGDDYARIVKRYTNMKILDDVLKKYQFLHKPDVLTKFLSNK